jgi:hypothetical protein
MIIERLADPVVIVPGLAAGAVMASGVAARVFEWWEMRRSRRSPRTA